MLDTLIAAKFGACDRLLPIRFILRHTTVSVALFWAPSPSSPVLIFRISEKIIYFPEIIQTSDIISKQSYSK